MKKRRIIGTIITFGLLPLSVTAFVLSAGAPRFVERFYTRGIYPVMASVLSTVTGLLPFSLAELLIYGAVLFVLYGIIKGIGRILLRRVRLRTQLVTFVRRVFLYSGLVYFLFIFLWGCNNNRLTLEEREGLDTASVTALEVEHCVQIEMRRAAAGARSVKRNDKGVMKDAGWDTLAVMVRQAYHDRGTVDPLAAGVYGTPKKYLFASLLSDMGTGGFYFPFTGEATCNGDIPAVTLPFVMAHEMAHQRGVARENEANFMAYQVCAASSQPELRYSAHVVALRYLLGSLKKRDLKRYEALRATLDPMVRADMDHVSAFWLAHKGRVRDAFDAWNDLFLKASNQKDGSGSYGRFINILVAVMRKGSL